MLGEKWANEEEIIEELKSDSGGDCGGSTLYSKNGIRYVNNKEGHTAEFGRSGSGKSRRFSYSTAVSVLQNGESLIAVDPKGELYRYTACYATKRHLLIRYDFRDLLNSEGWNPLDMIYELYHSGNPENRELAESTLDELSHNLYPEPDHQDPFWSQSARSVFIGAVHVLLDYAEKEEVNIYNVYSLIATGEERFGASTYLKEFVNMLPKDSIASMLLTSYVTTASDTKAGIRSVFLEGISLFARSEGLKRFSSDSDVKINNLTGDRPVAIYIVIPDESSNYDALCGNLVSQLLNHYISIAQRKHDGVLPCRLNVILEELGNIGKAINNLPHLMSAGRSRNIRLYLILQSISQLKDTYGESKMETILGNVSTTVAFSSNNYDTLKELSQRCGERYIKVDGHLQKEPLITPAQLGAMEVGQALVIIGGRVKYITKFPDFEEVYHGSKIKLPEKREYEKNYKVKMFDLKGFVKKKKQESMGELKLPNNPFGFNDSKDIDKIIRDIDKKIAELEKEEEEEKKKLKEEEDNKSDSEQIRDESIDGNQSNYIDI